ncbi:hypothetical protein Taro_030559, partial [Colocasia esculenta]|nr:hypothetical protein [Colocasia esculenta]
MKVNQAANLEANKHTSGSVSFATHQSRLEKELKRPSTFQEVFDKTHKKKGTDQYISNRAQEVAESYSQQMTEKYAGEKEQLQLDREGDIWCLEFKLTGDWCIHHTWCSRCPTLSKLSSPRVYPSLSPRPSPKLSP